VTFICLVELLTNKIILYFRKSK